MRRVLLGLAVTTALIFAGSSAALANGYHHNHGYRGGGHHYAGYGPGGPRYGHGGYGGYRGPACGPVYRGGYYPPAYGVYGAVPYPAYGGASFGLSTGNFSLFVR